MLFRPLWLTAPQPQHRTDYQVWLSAGKHDPLVTVATVQRVARPVKKLGQPRP
ncbi:hypothetical protein L3X07_01435 [Levilactobacillus brevis]|nr:hypothetical protein [Levilactobacillus brevis]